VETDGVDSTEDRSTASTEETGVEGSTEDPSVGGEDLLQDTDTTDQGNQDGESAPSDEELARQRETAVEADDDLEPGHAESEQTGIPIPVSSGTVVVGVTALLAVLILYRMSQVDTSEQSEDEQRNQGFEEPESLDELLGSKGDLVGEEDII